MHILAQILFVLLLSTAVWLIRRRVLLIAGAIKLGKPENRSNNPEQRLRQMLLLAFGQKKMFNKPWVGLMHFIIYAGFLIINIEMLEILIDGIFGTHRVLFGVLGSFYPLLISFFEVLAVGVIIVCLAFLYRRNVMNIGRFHKPELTAWPLLDANIILVSEILVMMAFLKMDAADLSLQARGVSHYFQTGNFLVSGLLTPFFSFLSNGMLVAVERLCWWFHITGVLGFALYVTYSKHLHIFLAFPNTYFARLEPAGELHNMPAITREVQLMLGLPVADSPETGSVTSETPAEPGRFGAKDVNDLSWKNLMDAYSCSECGRCTEACPANSTGKKLSPRKIMMDTRDRLEEVGLSLQKHGPGLADGKTLYGDYISKEELLACTTCNACTEACPININPLDIIVELRRYMIMEETSAPASWNALFSNTENNMAPWAFPPSDRFNWKEKV